MIDDAHKPDFLIKQQNICVFSQLFSQQGFLAVHILEKHTQKKPVIPESVRLSGNHSCQLPPCLPWARRKDGARFYFYPIQQERNDC